MVNMSSRMRNILVLSLIGIAVAGPYGYTKYSYAKTVASEIDNLKPFDSEKIKLIAVHESEKNFSLQLSIAGVTLTSSNIEAVKSYYDDLAVDYVCNSASFESQFDEGYQISFDIRYSDQPDTTFKKTFVAKQQCASAKS